MILHPTVSNDSFAINVPASTPVTSPDLSASTTIYQIVSVGLFSHQRAFQAFELHSLTSALEGPTFRDSNTSASSGPFRVFVLQTITGST